jgi:hypothetical protein
MNYLLVTRCRHSKHIIEEIELDSIDKVPGILGKEFNQMCVADQNSTLEGLKKLNGCWFQVSSSEAFLIEYDGEENIDIHDNLYEESE